LSVVREIWIPGNQCSFKNVCPSGTIIYFGILQIAFGYCDRVLSVSREGYCVASIWILNNHLGNRYLSACCCGYSSHGCLENAIILPGLINPAGTRKTGVCNILGCKWMFWHDIAFKGSGISLCNVKLSIQKTRENTKYFSPAFE
jgi:hypothetical protein